MERSHEATASEAPPSSRPALPIDPGPADRQTPPSVAPAALVQLPAGIDLLAVVEFYSWLAAGYHDD